MLKHPHGYINLRHLIDTSDILESDSLNIPYKYKIVLNFIGGEQRILYYKNHRDAKEELNTILNTFIKGD